MNMNMNMNMIKRTWYPPQKCLIVKIYHMYKVKRVVLLLYHIDVHDKFWKSFIYNFAYNAHWSLNGLSKSDQTFTVGFVKLLSNHPIHIVLGNLPFKVERATWKTHFLQIHNPKQLDKLCSFLLSWIMESQLQLELVYSNRNIWMQNGQTITLT